MKATPRRLRHEARQLPMGSSGRSGLRFFEAVIADTKSGNLEQFATDLRHLGLDIEVVVVEALSRCVGATIGEVESLGAGTFLIVALERRSGETILQPHPDVVINDGESVAVVRRAGREQAIEQLFSAPKITNETMI